MHRRKKNCPMLRLPRSQINRDDLMVQDRRHRNVQLQSIASNPWRTRCDFSSKAVGQTDYAKREAGRG
jgi:hypothetical protein